MEKIDETNARLERYGRWAMWLSVVMIVVPLGMLLILLLLHGVESAQPSVWLFFIGLTWFIFAEDRVKCLARETRVDVFPRVFTEARREWIAEAVVFAPVFAFCLVREGAEPGQIFADWAIGVVILFLLFIVVNEARAQVGAAWRRWRGSK